MLEEVIDPLLFHEPAGKGKIRFAILDAIIARVEVPLNPVDDVQPSEHLFQDVGDGQVLEDAALHFFGPEPQLRGHFGPVMGEVRVAAALRETADDAVEIPLRVAGQPEAYGHALTEQFLEKDLSAVLREQPQLKREELRDCLVALEPREQQDIRSERGGDLEEAIGLSISSHGSFQRRFCCGSR